MLCAWLVKIVVDWEIIKLIQKSEKSLQKILDTAYGLDISRQKIVRKLLSGNIEKAIVLVVFFLHSIFGRKRKEKKEVYS